MGSLVLLTAVGLFLVPTASAATRGETVVKLMEEDDYEEARRRCDKWKAEEPAVEPELREACAEAFWPLAEARNTPQAWADYGARWKGTEAEPTALEREAAAAFRIVSTDALETELLALADRYAGTRNERDFRKLAADAALRAARTSNDAVSVALRYPDHAGLPRLVEQFPDAFLRVSVTGRQVDVRLDPPVQLPAHQPVEVRWVAHAANGEVEDWDRSAGNYLVQWGVPETFVTALPRPEVGPAIPVCFAPGRPPGWSPAVEVRVGAGAVVQEIAWDGGCSEDAAPAFLTVADGQVVAASLAPGHGVDLRTGSARDRRQVAGWLTGLQGPPILYQGRFYLSAGQAWLVQPVSGGSPWATVQGPGDPHVELTAALQSGPLPEGYRLVPVPEGVEVEGGGQEGEPWIVLPGDIRVLTPLVQRTLDLTWEAAEPSRAPAPPLPADTEWIRTGTSGPVDPIAPVGAVPLALRALDEVARRRAVSALTAVGVRADLLEVVDGWALDLDGDGVEESLLRLAAGGTGAVLVVDPAAEPQPPVATADAGSAPPSLQSADRVFMAEVPTPSGATGARVAMGQPFAFRMRGQPYLAWFGRVETGGGAVEDVVQVLRSDGEGFVCEVAPPR